MLLQFVLDTDVVLLLLDVLVEVDARVHIPERQPPYANIDIRFDQLVCGYKGFHRAYRLQFGAGGPCLRYRQRKILNAPNAFDAFHGFLLGHGSLD